MRRGRGTSVAIAYFGMSLIGSTAIVYANTIKLDAKGIPLEAPQEVADRVAYTYQKKAIIKLRALVRRNQSSAKNPEIWLRLARVELENADFLFRIAHADAYETKKAINLKAYNAQMGDAIGSLTEYLNRFGSHAGWFGALTMRAKAYDDLNKRDLARADYLRLIEKDPSNPAVNHALLTLGGYELDDSNFEKAGSFFSQILRSPEAPEYPYALFKYSWCLYQQDRIRDAILYARQYVDFFDKKAAASPNNKSLLSSRDEMKVNLPLFYLKGYQLDPAGYPIESAYQFFRKFDPSADVYVLFAKLLRSNNLEKEEVKYRSSVYAENGAGNIYIEVAVLVFEDQFNKGRYPELKISLDQVEEAFAKSEDVKKFAPVRETLLTMGQRIQKILKNEKRDPFRKAWIKQLIPMLEVALKLDPAEQMGQCVIQYNLAQSHAELGDTDDASLAFKNVALQLKKKPTWIKSLPFPVHEPAVKALSLRYTSLLDHKMFPEKIDPQPLSGSPGAKSINKRPIPRPLAEFVAWVLDPNELGLETKNYAEADLYFLQANRVLYQYGEVDKAFRLMSQFIESASDSKVAPIVAGILLDTLVASQKWKEVVELSSRLEKSTASNDETFKRRVKVVKEDAYLKQVEGFYQSKDNQSVMNLAQEHEDFIANGDRSVEFLTFYSRSALALNQEDDGLKYISLALKRKLSPKEALPFRLQRAQIYEKRAQWNLAMEDYLAALGASSEEELRGRIIRIGILAGERKAFAPQVCEGKLAPRCKQIVALLDFEEKGAPRLAEAITQVADANGSFENRLKTFRGLDKQIAGLDPLNYARIEGEVKEKIPAFVSAWRGWIKQVVPVALNAGRIKQRLASVQNFEQELARISTHYSNAIQVQLLEEAGEAYYDFASELGTLAESQGVKESIQGTLDALTQTSTNLIQKSYTLAQENVVDENIFNEIARVLRTRQPTANGSSQKRWDFGVEVLESLDPQGHWDNLDDDVLKKEWAQAILSHRYLKASVLEDMLIEKRSDYPALKDMLRAVLLSLAGLESEGVLQVEKVFEKNKRPEIGAFLVNRFASTWAKDKVSRVLRSGDAPQILKLASLDSEVEEWAKK